MKVIPNEVVNCIVASRPDRIVCREKPYKKLDCFCLDWSKCDGKPVVRVGSMEICRGCWPILVASTLRMGRES